MGKREDEFMEAMGLNMNMDQNEIDINSAIEGVAHSLMNEGKTDSEIKEFIQSAVQKGIDTAIANMREEFEQGGDRIEINLSREEQKSIINRMFDRMFERGNVNKDNITIREGEGFLAGSYKIKNSFRIHREGKEDVQNSRAAAIELLTDKLITTLEDKISCGCRYEIVIGYMPKDSYAGWTFENARNPRTEEDIWCSICYLGATKIEDQQHD